MIAISVFKIPSFGRVCWRSSQFLLLMLITIRNDNKSYYFSYGAPTRMWRKNQFDAIFLCTWLNIFCAWLNILCVWLIMFWERLSNLWEWLINWWGRFSFLWLISPYLMFDWDSRTLIRTHWHLLFPEWYYIVGQEKVAGSASHSFLEW